MGQLEQDYRGALDGLRFSDAGKERIVKNLMERQEREPVKGKRFRPLRTALIAAALCLALVGTAFGATAAYRLMVQAFDSRDYNGEKLMGFELFGKVDRYTLKEFSQQLQDDYNAWVSHKNGSSPSKEFDSWEDAKAYLGDGIPCIWWDTGTTIRESTYRVSLTPNLGAETDGLQYVQLYSRSQLESRMTCETVVLLYGEEDPRINYSMAGPLGSEIKLLGDYSMANGCTAQIVTQASPHDGDWVPSYCMGFFVNSGLLYEVTIFSGDPNETGIAEMEAQLYQVLDSFA